MSLVRAWTRQLYGASGVALLVPGTLIGALVVLALAGGFGGLGLLGEAFSGPALPGASTLAGARASSRAASPLTRTLTGAVVRPATARSAVAGAALGSTAGAGSPAALGGAGGPAGKGGSNGSHGQGQGGSGGQGAQGPPTSSPPRRNLTPPPEQTVPPTGIDGVVGIGASVTKQVPAPVGSAATQALQSVGATVNRVLPLHAPDLAAGASHTLVSGQLVP